MSETAIRVENLGKLYRIGAARQRHDTLRDALSAGVRQIHRPRKRSNSDHSGNSGQRDESFWALRDVSFEVQRGEIVGVIGRNGAGKSTLLKILSRITEPTTGRVELHGRVGSLLEVGTGFHPELTGRENIYLNGAILGMKKAEIARRFDEIIAFAEIERFLDTPVKRYSSGMYVRLAFAVAAHLEPEILLVDEVLAVGDAAFQKKCLGKMGQVAGEGRTVLFVSHNMAAIARLCERAIVFDAGRLSLDGPSHRAIALHSSGDMGTQAQKVWSDPATAPGDCVVRLHAVRVVDSRDAVCEHQHVGEPIYVEVEYWNLQTALKPVVSLHFLDDQDNLLVVSNDFSNEQWWDTPRSVGRVKAICAVPGYLFAEGRVMIRVAICTYSPDVIHVLTDKVVGFRVVDRTADEGSRGVYGQRWPGLVRPRLSWRIESTTLDHHRFAPQLRVLGESSENPY
jgi:lipopolysaccharide transport system ATP-binding protein